MEMIASWTSTSDALDELGNSLKCSVCNELLQNPCTLGNCDHLFCSDCIARHKGVSCPICGAPTWAKDLQVKRELANVVQLYKKLRKIIVSGAEPDDNSKRTDNEYSLQEDTYSLEEESLIPDMEISDNEEDDEKEGEDVVTMDCNQFINLDDKEDNLLQKTVIENKLEESVNTSSLLERRALHVRNVSSFVKKGQVISKLNPPEVAERDRKPRKKPELNLNDENDPYAMFEFIASPRGENMKKAKNRGKGKKTRRAVQTRKEMLQKKIVKANNKWNKIGNKPGTARTKRNEANNSSRSVSFIESNPTSPSVNRTTIESSVEIEPEPKMVDERTSSGYDILDDKCLVNTTSAECVPSDLNGSTMILDHPHEENKKHSGSTSSLQSNAVTTASDSMEENQLHNSALNIIKANEIAKDEAKRKSPRLKPSSKPKTLKQKMNESYSTAGQFDSSKTKTIPTSSLANETIQSEDSGINCEPLKEINKHEKRKKAPKQKTQVRREKRRNDSCTEKNSTILPDSTLEHKNMAEAVEENIKIPTPQREVTKRNVRGETPLHVACIKGDLDLVKSLLERGADPNAKDNAGWTSLHESCNHGFTAIASILLDSGAVVDVPGFENDAPLHDAINNNQLEVVKLLMERGASLDVRNINGLTPKDLPMSAEIRSALEVQPNVTSDLNTSLSSSFSSSPSVASQKIVLLATGLKDNQKSKLLTCARILHGKVATDFTPNVTHLVANSSSNGKCVRTMKFLQAVLLGKWVVDFAWVEECMRRKSRAPETTFEICGSTADLDSEGAKRGREYSLKQFPGLFDGCNFFLYGSFVAPTPPKEDLASLIRLGGGTILTRHPKPDDDVIQATDVVPYHVKQDSELASCSYFIIYDHQVKNYPQKVRTAKLCTAPVSWLMSCISKYELLDLP